MAALCSSVAWASYPDGYYDSLDGKSGLDLKRAVKAVAASHRTISYGTSTWSAFRSTDVKTVNGTDYWWDMYSSNLVRTSGHDGMNIEHSVANSWWGKTKNDAYKDIVHLNPSDATANSRKSNYPLSEIAGEPTWTNGVTNVGRPVSGQGGGSNNVFEPHDDYKGDFARAFLYMFTIYDDISWKTSGTNWMYDTQNPYLLKDWAADLLLKWNMNDPVTTESRRNRKTAIPLSIFRIWQSTSGVRDRARSIAWTEPMVAKTLSLRIPVATPPPTNGSPSRIPRSTPAGPSRT